MRGAMAAGRVLLLSIGLATILGLAAVGMARRLVYVIK